MAVGWFTVETLDADTFAISEYGHWEQTHSYLVCGTEKAVLIDTGLGVGDIRKEVSRLTNLPVEVLTTHAHWDHIGGHGQFSQIAVHRAEQEWLSGHFPLSVGMVRRSLTQEPCRFPEGFDADRYELYRGGAQTLFQDGEKIGLGGRTLQVIHTPGHSPGHCCFYEPERGYLYAGDLIYAGCLYAFYPTTDPQLFWESVRRVGQLEVSRVLPGHHNLQIPTELIGKIGRGFEEISQRGELCQGNGIYEFEGFAIHI